MLRTVERIISSWDLIDFKPKKGRYTWSNNRIGSANISARLDRFLLQSSFLTENKIISSSILPKLSSDHKPILLQFIDDEDIGPIPFKFSPLWIDKEGFLDTVGNSWKIPVFGSPNFVWERKLKHTTSVLKEWIKLSPHFPINDRILAVTSS